MTAMLATIAFLLPATAGAQTISPATQPPAPAPAAAPSPVMAGSEGTPLTAKSAAGAVTLAVDKAPQGKRLSIRIVAANFGSAPAPFGPDAVTLIIDGKPLAVATPDDLVARKESHSARDSTLARVASAPNIAGFGQRDTTQDDNPNESTGGMAGERYGRAERNHDDDERDRLRQALLGQVDVQPHGHQGGALLTGDISDRAKTLDIAVAFAGDTYRFTIKLASK